MNLPDLFWQNAYGRVAWVLVLTALVLAVMALRRTPSRRSMVTVLAGVSFLMALPGPWSPVHWIGLAFQRPSALGVALCVMAIEARWWGRTGRTTMTLPLAGAIALGGGLLYLDSSGWLSRGLYTNGFGPVGAPVAGLLIAGVAVAGLVLGRCTAHAVALLAAVLAFALWRLPTGNLWDALIDPFVWVWAVAVLVRRVRRPQWRVRRPRQVVVEPATVI